MAPPPIQLPAIVVKPLQTKSASNPSIKLGNVYDIRIIENGPPIIIPNVPLKNITIAFGPNFIISGKSILMVSKTKLAGNKYRDATKYKFE